MFDLSNYSKDSKVFDPANENFIGKTKDAHKGQPIGEIIGFKSKMSSILLDNLLLKKFEFVLIA